jgi:hypothetical protein
MAVLALNPRFRRITIMGCQRELTLAEMLADSIVQAVMKADGVDAKVLEAQLQSLARDLSKMPRASRNELMSGESRYL